MRLDPEISVARLLTAIPSSALAFGKLGIAVQLDETKSLQQVCADRGIAVEEFWRAMDAIDWNQEAPSNEISTGP